MLRAGPVVRRRAKPGAEAMATSPVFSCFSADAARAWRVIKPETALRVVGPCASRGDQAIALGVDVGGRVARIDPQRMNAGLANASFRHLGEPFLGGGMGR